jgi:hypothetical protein
LRLGFADNPDNVRLHDWYSLQAGDDVGDGDVRLTLQLKVDAIREAQRTGHVDPVWKPVDLLLLLIDIARTMAVPHALSTSLAHANEGLSDVATRRREAVEAARRLIRPAQSGSAPGSTG